MDIDDTTHCTLDTACATCETTIALEVTTLDLAHLGGVCCVTLCADCVDTGRLPALGWTSAIELIWDHCSHLGTDPDSMAAILAAEAA